MLKPFLLFYCICILFPVKNMIDYCDICKNKSYTMCKYENNTIKSCFNYTTTTVTPKIQNVIVELHNQLRGVIASGTERRGDPGPQPPAANMLMMRWNSQLATSAQQWAEQCAPVVPENLDECNITDRFQIGENIVEMNADAQPIATEAIITAIIMQWYNEVIHLNWMAATSHQRSVNNSNSVNHYLRMVRASVESVGCAYVSFVEHLLNTKKHVELKRLICNYKPMENMPDDLPYKAGESCSECKLKCSELYPALCDDTAENNYSVINMNSKETFSKVIEQQETATTLPQRPTNYDINDVKINKPKATTSQGYGPSTFDKFKPATNLEIKEKLHNHIKMPQYKIKSFKLNPQTVHNYDAINMQSQNFEFPKIQLQTADNSTQWNVETVINVEEPTTISNDVRPKVINVFQQLLEQIHAASTKYNISDDVENIIANAIKTSYLDYADEIELRSGKNKENEKSESEGINQNLTDIDMKLKNTNKKRITSSEELVSSTPISTKGSKTSESSTQIISTKTSKMFSTQTPPSKITNTVSKKVVVETTAEQISSTETTTKLISSTETKVESSKQREVLTSTTESSTVDQKGYSHDDSNCPFKHYQFPTPFRSHLKEGDPCYCLYRIRSCAAKVPIKPFLLYIILFYILL